MGLKKGDVSLEAQTLDFYAPLFGEQLLLALFSSGIYVTPVK